MKTKIVAGIFFLVALASFSFRDIEKRKVKRSMRNSDPTGSVYIIIDKSDYELNVYDEEGWYATYPVVFGNKDLGDKLMEGDKRTPEGSFKITSKRPLQQMA